MSARWGRHDKGRHTPSRNASATHCSHAIPSWRFTASICRWSAGNRAGRWRRRLMSAACSCTCSRHTLAFVFTNADFRCGRSWTISIRSEIPSSWCLATSMTGCLVGRPRTCSIAVWGEGRGPQRFQCHGRSLRWIASGFSPNARFDESRSMRARPPDKRRITFPWWQIFAPIDGSFKPERPRRNCAPRLTGTSPARRP